MKTLNTILFCLILSSLVAVGAQAQNAARKPPVIDVEEIVNICRENYAQRRSLLVCSRKAFELVDVNNKVTVIRFPSPNTYPLITEKDLDNEYTGDKIISQYFTEIKNSAGHVIGFGQVMNIALNGTAAAWKAQVTVYFDRSNRPMAARAVAVSQ